MSASNPSALEPMSSMTATTSSCLEASDWRGSSYDSDEASFRDSGSSYCACCSLWYSLSSVVRSWCAKDMRNTSGLCQHERRFVACEFASQKERERERDFE